VDKLLPTLVIVAVLAVLVLLAVLGWRRRVRRDRSSGGGYPLPERPAAATVTADVLYVATTRAGDQLERLALPGLAFRGKGSLAAAPDGVTVRVAGEQPVFLPATALSSVGTATYAIDRAVERDGLLRLGWTTSGGTAADSYFRVVDPAGAAPVTAAIQDIIPAAASAGDSESEV
jgi:hypothetical protein